MPASKMVSKFSYSYRRNHRATVQHNKANSAQESHTAYTRLAYANAWTLARAKRRLNPVDFETAGGSWNMIALAYLPTATKHFYSRHEVTAVSKRNEDSDRLYETATRYGERYERAALARNFDTMLETEALINALAAAHKTMWIAVGIARGQNNIRRMRGLE